MKKYSFVLCLFLAISNLSYSQFVLGKAYVDATKELKAVFLNNNLHFLKQEEMGEQPGGGFVYRLRFKEEFTVVIFINDYENVKWMTFESENFETYYKIKSIYKYLKWEISANKDFGDKEYLYLNYVITEFRLGEYIGSNAQVYKFMIKEKK
jgi:hypothetical protein